MKNDKPPLRKYLVGEIEREGYLSLDTITNIAITFGHKQDTARRILNKDMSENIEPVYNDKHQIKGYKLKEENGIMGASEEDNQAKESKIISPKEESVASVLPMDKDTGLQERNVQMYNLRSSETNQGDARRSRNWGQTQLFTI